MISIVSDLCTYFGNIDFYFFTIKLYNNKLNKLTKTRYTNSKTYTKRDFFPSV